MRVLDDTRHASLVYRHDRGVAADEIRATRLERPLVPGISLHAGEAHADNYVVADAGAAVDRHRVVLREPVTQDVEHVAALSDRRHLAGADPFDLRIEHALDRVEIARDERAIPAQQQIDSRLAHARSGTGKAGASARFPLRRRPS